MSSVRSGTSCGWKTDVAVKARDQEPESPVEWLENKLRETKARLHKVEGELDQALKQVWSLEADVRRVAEAFSVSGSASAALAALREDVRQLYSQMGKTQDRHSALANRTEEIFRQRQTETGRDRQDLSEVTKLVGGVTKSIEHLENRVQSMEEASRRMEEGVAGGHLADEALERQIEDLSIRTTRAHEAELVGLTSQLSELSEFTRAQLKRASQVQLRQRRRQHEALAQEIKELGQDELQGGD